jgi:hypothetical protein
VLVAGEHEGTLHARPVDGLHPLVRVLLDHGEEVPEQAPLEGVQA